MLSRVAENIYWMSRYIERAENTARLISAASNLMLDLPKSGSRGWESLIAISGCDDKFRKHGNDYDERAVLRFMISAKDNPASILASVTYARENCRTIRGIVPRKVWEQINALHQYAQERKQEGLSKRGRHHFLDQIVMRCQTIAGIVTGCMNRDQGYQFLRLGRSLERADMTTRILDVSAASLLQEEGENLEPFANTRWMAVLKSLSAYQMYRHSQQPRVQRSTVVRFLLRSTVFPRAVFYCIDQVEESISALPRNEPALHSIGNLKRFLMDTHLNGLIPADLHRFLDEVQVAVSGLSREVAQIWFLPAPASAASEAD